MKKANLEIGTTVEFKVKGAEKGTTEIGLLVGKDTYQAMVSVSSVDGDSKVQAVPYKDVIGTVEG